MKFKSNYYESRERLGGDYAFVFSGSEILVKNDSVPLLDEVELFLAENSIEPKSGGKFFGTIGRVNCYAFSLPAGFDTDDFESLAGDSCGVHQFVLLRRYLTELDTEVCEAAGFASHLLHWDLHSRFCGSCGEKNNWYKSEWAKKCPECGNVQFPKISPAIIIMIRKGNDILLAHNKNFPEGRYSLLAGFMEIGETIEETAAREVREEVGIEIENIQYISSQSWPFPDSLMIGLSADYKSGDIEPDGTEIIHAGWYNTGNFPSIPGHGTIARRIIDKYTKTQT